MKYNTNTLSGPAETMEIERVWFTSDNHFYHSNILQYCNRPFADVYEMNDILIDNWNSLISNKDVVYHLGDFGFGATELLKFVRNKLNGYIILVRGNHDRSQQSMLTAGFNEVHFKVTVRYQTYNFLLKHKPLNEEEARLVEKETIVLCGHIHSKPEDKLRIINNFLHYDVGVDPNDYFPVNLDKICEQIENFNKRETIGLDTNRFGTLAGEI